MAGLMRCCFHIRSLAQSGHYKLSTQLFIRLFLLYVQLWHKIIIIILITLGARSAPSSTICVLFLRLAIMLQRFNSVLLRGSFVWYQFCMISGRVISSPVFNSIFSHLKQATKGNKNYNSVLSDLLCQLLYAQGCKEQPVCSSENEEVY